MGVVAIVTGVSRYLGGKMADRLVDQPGIDRVIGVDVVPPPRPLAAEFVRADIRNPAITKLLDEAGVDTVVHMGVIATPRQAGGRSLMKDINVIGTMQLLGACQRAESVRRLVVKSTAAVYGSGPKDPAMISEGSPRGTHRHRDGQRIRWKSRNTSGVSRVVARMLGSRPCVLRISSVLECGPE